MIEKRTPESAGLCPIPIKKMRKNFVFSYFTPNRLSKESNIIEDFYCE